MDLSEGGSIQNIIILSHPFSPSNYTHCLHKRLKVGLLIQFFCLPVSECLLHIY